MTRLTLGYCCLIFSVILLSCDREIPTTVFSKMESGDTGIDFRNTLVETLDLNVFTYDYLYNGAGVAAGDLNHDGLIDLYFIGNSVSNKLYLNEGNFDFEDVTEETGTAGKPGWKTGVSMADVNGDGWLDIYVCYSGPESMTDRSNQLFINNGSKDGAPPTFTERAREFGIEGDSTYSTQATFFDFDLDGDLDLFMLNHGIDYKSSYVQAMKKVGQRNPYYGNRLYRNDNNKFVEVSEQAGIHGGWLNYGLSVSVSDFNSDGFPDLYVSNDFDERDFFYLNKGDGTFEESLKECFGHISKYTMGSDAADINNDQLTDLVTLDMLPNDNHRKKLLKGPDAYDQYTSFVDKGYHKQQMRNMLHVNQGMGPDGLPVFSEVGQLAGISSTDWSWSSLFADFDNDGRKDLFVTNGYLRDLTNLDFQRYDFEGARKQALIDNIDMYADEGKQFMLDLINKMESIKVSNYIFRNSDGLHFQDKTREWGMYEPLLTTGAVYADLDNDGDLDLITNNINDQAGIYRNNTNALSKNHYLKVKLEGEKGNTNGIGAKIYLSTETQKQFSEAFVARGFMSSVDPAVHFGLGADAVVKNLIIEWSNGKHQTLTNLPADTTIVVKQSQATDTSRVIKKEPVMSVITDVTKTAGLSFQHQENKYVDFKYERLLLGKLSDQGPKLASADVNGDHLEDVFIGGAIGQGGKLFLRKEDGSFYAASLQPWDSEKECEDVGAAFFDADGDGDNDLVIASGGVEYPAGSPKLEDRLYLNDGKGRFSRSQSITRDKKGGSSCVKAADFDHDGDQDLFIGGWVLPSSFPKAAPSVLLRNDSDKRKGKIQFTPVTPERLSAAGLVTDALWTDVDKDGWADLMVVGLWMPVKIFKNDQGVLADATDQFGLKDTGGLWNTVEGGDFDGDGDTDYLVGNLGTNGELPASKEAPLQIYYDDFDKNGEIDPIICYQEQGKTYPVATRDDIISQIPSLKKKFLRYAQYADATIESLLSKEQLDTCKKLEVRTLQTAYFINNNGKLEMHSLPAEVQVAPVQAIITGHFNGDKLLDALLVGNLYSYRVEYGPFDASNGILLLGTSMAEFKVASSAEKGVFLNGDIRDAILLNDGDIGYSTVVIAYNNGVPKVFRVNAQMP
jgi:enediyne biosynthesis protein E4